MLENVNALSPCNVSYLASPYGRRVQGCNFSVPLPSTVSAIYRARDGQIILYEIRRTEEHPATAYAALYVSHASCNKKLHFQFLLANPHSAVRTTCAILLTSVLTNQIDAHCRSGMKMFSMEMFSTQQDPNANNSCVDVKILLHFALIVDKRNVLWPRTSVCLSVCTCVCMSLAAFPHYCTHPDVSLYQW